MTVSMKDRRWYTTGQVGSLINMSDDTIVRYIREGEIKATRTAGGRFKIDRQELVAFLKKFKYDVEV